ncbi:Fructosamine kinase-domain-containing protein [Daldinia loculata]|uniref:Fructosamine kinase-domain-containing protein n=1 Tax=Daldinia loculata TaxID=103429 RepID=UPI0020C2ECD1|nr:Fructosamine kinase-domain-containing protein [Daldinia loculata]KAI1644309.1 Fructosamine kinase-domain-containing protein [Daldinia loculata]
MADEHASETMVPIEAIQTVDPEVIAKIPLATQISIVPHGISLWTRTARLDVERDGVRKAYFLKTSYGALGRAMTQSEFRCMSRMRRVAPDLVPEPLASGSFSSVPDVHFLLCEFRRMTGTVPVPEALAAKIAELHRCSGGGSGGKFGSDVPTFHGNVRVDHGWSGSWEEYFARTTKVLFGLEQEAQGPNEEIKAMIAPFFDKVVPRLLRPLETGGRSIQPCLIHGDLWHGNAETDAETGLPVIFDAASFYAHNECEMRADELGVWRQPWNKIGEAYRAEYHKYMPKSQPEEDCDDRNALYAVDTNNIDRGSRVNILDSILYKDDPSYRHMLISGMRELVDKFPGGFEEWDASQEKEAYK